MQQVRLLIVEDESLVAMDMADMLTRLGYEVLPAAYNYEQAVELLDSENPDIVLADIDLGAGKTGIDLARYIRQKHNLPLIFITSHADKQTVASAAATQPNGYLVKPFAEEDLYTSIEVALANYNGNKPRTSAEPEYVINDCLFVKTDTHFVKVSIDEILWLESDHNYLYINTHKGKHIVRSNFRDFLVNLPGALFMQIHKSYVVNLKKIEQFSHTEVLINKTALPLSRNYKDELFEKIRRVQ